MAELAHLTPEVKVEHLKVLCEIFEIITKCPAWGSIMLVTMNTKLGEFKVQTTYGRNSLGHSYHTHDLSTYDGQVSLLNTCSAVVLETSVNMSSKRRKTIKVKDLQPWLEVARLLREIC